MIQDQLITSGFPRSGNTYLNHALHLLYYPNYELNWNRHTVSAIDNSEKIIVPFRNPIDAIASWHNYPSDATLISDMAYYRRFHSGVVEKLHKVILMDFDQFTTDLDYIINKINNEFNVKHNKNVTDEEIKTLMMANDKKINLPQNNQNDLVIVKEQLKNIPEIEQCIEIYTQLKTSA